MAFALLHGSGALIAYNLERETLGRELDKTSDDEKDDDTENEASKD